MTSFTTLETGGNLNDTIAGLLRRLLDEKIVGGVLVQSRQPYRKVVMPTLITDPAQLADIDPFAPVAPVSAARVAANLTARPAGRPVALVLRGCEVRAYIELVKLHQASLDDVILIGLDCLGRYENSDYLRLVAEDPELTMSFLVGHGNGKPRPESAPEISRACQSCEHPMPDAVDLRLCVVGLDPTRQLGIEWVSDKGEELRKTLDYPADTAPSEREALLAAHAERRAGQREQMLGDIVARTADLAGLAEVVSSCVNCYNCRNACPVCYCRECVFSTETFRHDGEQYLRWADKRGSVRMPADTVFYHLTRMIHVSALCVGCGQCSSACPNDVPVMELLQSAAVKTQARFEYVPGRSVEEGQPLAIFHDEEFIEVTGGQVK